MYGKIIRDSYWFSVPRLLHNTLSWLRIITRLLVLECQRLKAASISGKRDRKPDRACNARLAHHGIEDLFAQNSLDFDQRDAELCFDRENSIKTGGDTISLFAAKLVQSQIVEQKF